MHLDKTDRGRALKQLFQLALIFVFLSALVSISPVQGTAARAEDPAPVLAPGDIANVSVNAPATAMLAANVSFSVDFDNDSAATTGYGPFIDVALDRTGADGVEPGTPAPANTYDGLSTNTTISATYLGTPINASDIFVVVFNAAGNATHPLMRNLSGAFVVVNAATYGAAPGDKLVVVRLPFGSFTPAQPTATVNMTVNMSNLADIGTGLFINARGGYQYGTTPLDDWCCGDVASATLGALDLGTVTPTLFTLAKSFSGPEGETATGPNFPRTYTVTATIAAGQTISNLQLTDLLPDNIQFVSMVTPAAASCPSLPASPSTSTPGGTLTCNFASAGGTVNMTYTFYVPELYDIPNPPDPDSAFDDPVIDPVTGDDANSCNNGSITGGTWPAVDTRDANVDLSANPYDPAGCEANHVNKSIAIQKGLAGTPGPGNTFTYTLAFEVSDFFSFDDVTITDFVSDGQRLDTSFTPTLQVNGNGYIIAASNFAAANYDVNCYYTPVAGGGTGAECENTFPVDSGNPDEYGTTQLVFHVSDQVDVTQLNGFLLGGCVIPVTGGLVSPCDTFGAGDGPTTGTIVFRTTVQERFSDNFPSGDFSVDQGDLLGDHVTNNGIVLSNTTFAPVGAEDDDSAASATIPTGTLTKSLYAVNGSAPSGSPVTVKPGDTVTYRIQYVMPVSDEENLEFSDYLPLPVFHVDDPDENGIPGPAWTFDPTVSATAPAAGFAQFGPADTFFAYSGITPTLASSTPENRLTFTYGDFDDTGDTSTIVDLLFTVTVSDDPFADGLYLTNEAHAFEGSTNGGLVTANAIIQIVLTEPLLTNTKTIFWTDNTTGVYSTPVGGGTVTVLPPASTPRWTGNINSTYLDVAPARFNANISHLDGGDIVSFAIVIRNTGTSLKGAFDIEFRDTLQSQYQIPTGGLNLQVYYGNGLDSINYFGLGALCTGTWPGDPCGPDGIANTADDLFGNGLQLDDSVTPADCTGSGTPGNPCGPDNTAGTADDPGVCQAHDPNLGNDVILITYDLQIRTDVTPGTVINTSSLTHYAGVEGGPNHLSTPETDTATVTWTTPAVAKSLKSTSEANTSDVSSPPRVAIGEVVRYRLAVTLPEASFPDFQIDDNLPAGLVYLDDGTARVAFISNGTGISSTDAGTLPIPAIPAGCLISGNEATAIPDPLPCLLADLNVGINTSITVDDLDTQASYTTGLDPQFKLGDLINEDNDTDLEFVIMEFNALVDNSTAGSNDAGDNRNNTFSMNVNGAAYGPTSAALQVRVSEAVITDLAKGVSPTSGDAGDLVTYTVTFSNAIGVNNTTAFDVNLTDTAPVKMTLNLGSLTTSFTPAACSSLTSDASALNNIDLLFGIVPVGCQVTVTYQATLLATVNPGEALINTANVTYTSLPGPNGTTGNATASDTPGATGTDTGERDGSGAPVLNDYFDSDSAQVDVTAIQPGKTLISSSDLLTIGSNLTIGEVGRYRMTILLAEGTSPSFQILDNIPAGLEYMDDGETSVAFVSDDNDATCGTSTATITSSALFIGTFPWICGNETTVATITPTFDLPGLLGFITGGPFSEGVDPTFDLSDITNTDTDANSEYIVVEFNARVLNVSGNQDVPLTTIDNTYTVFINAINKGTSGPATITVVESVIALDKQLASITGQADAGGLANYSVTLTNSGTAPAYDSNYVDTLPAVLDLNHLSVNVAFAGGASGSTDNSSNLANRVDVVIGTIPVGGSVTITYNATILASVTPEQLIQNTGDVTWTSLSGTDANERNGTGGINDYSATDTASFTSAAVTITKQLTATSASHTSGSNVVIGEIITYDILLTFPEGTTASDTVVDNMPAGLEVVSGSAEVISTTAATGSILTSNFNGGPIVPVIVETAAGVTFNFSNVVAAGDNNNTNNTIQLRFRARVTNTAGNQDVPLTTLSNTASNQVGAGAPVASNTVDATVVEALLTVTKSVTDTTPAVGQVLTFTLVLTHTPSTPDAFDILMTDALPVELDLDETTVIVSPSGPPGSVINAQFTTTPANILRVTADSMRQNGIITVTFDATVIGAYGVPFSNNVAAAWSSLFGNVAGERNGSGGVNDYVSTDSVLFNVDRALDKSLIASNVTSTLSPEVTIGEILTYQIVLTIPASSLGSTDTAIITDTLDNGLAFVDCSQMTAGAGITSTTVDFTSAANCNHGASAGSNPRISNSGRKVTFNLGDISNVGNGPETITLTYRVIVLDIASNVQNVTLDNDVEWTWTGGTLSTVAVPSLRIVEPKLIIEKSVDPEVAALGSVVTYSILVEHTFDSQTTAYDVLITDGIQSGLALDQASVTVINPTGGLPAAVITTSPTQFSVYWSQFPLLERAIITFQAVYEGPDAVFNTASAQWRTLQIDPLLPLQPQSVYNTSSTERGFLPADDVNNYSAAATIRLSVPRRLPRTGFAPGEVTLLPEMPEDFSYTALGDLWLEIPELGVKEDIVGVPLDQADWNLTWLGNNAGYLDGTAYPTHAGNTGITAHAYLADGTPGPFVNLDTLSYGDQIIVHLGGEKYIYEVREEKLVRPDSVASVLKHEELPWLTLITCKTYSESTDDYVYRTVVRAVLVDVVSE